ncbi:MAG: AAA family ATPase [Chitinophagaceae bacterium]|nr:AAA family ATPase [Chitinophagaceae bacterium]
MAILPIKDFATAAASAKGQIIHHVDLLRFKGEWEKDLDVLFVNAKKNNWTLFFDEADALFGKRTNIQDAHDRYSDTEINYLLLRLEEYKGKVVIGRKDPDD